jgi:hypothetical protein
MRQVRNAAGFSATRSFDAVAVSLWPSRGMEIHAFEVKCSRSDWQRELADPAKADDAAKLVDRFWVVGPRDVIPEDEVPAAWGLIHISGGVETFEEVRYDGLPPHQIRRVEGRKIRRVRAAPLLRPRTKGAAAPGVPRTFLIPMLRAVGATPDPIPPAEKALAAAREVGAQRERERAASRASYVERELTDLRTVLREFQHASGLYLHANNAAELGQRVRRAFAAAPNTVPLENTLKICAADLQRAAERVLALADGIGQAQQSAPEPAAAG